MTHYNTLGVADSATAEEIKQAYRRLANKHHPDRGGDTAEFQKIQAAYNVLSDDNARAQYDAEQRGGNFHFNINGQDFNGGGMPPHMEEMLRNFGFSFGHGFANGGDPFAQLRQPRRNKDTTVELVVSLASTLDVQHKTISIQNTNGERDTVEVQIPRGVRPNSTIKYPGLGDNFFGSLPRGDLYIKILVEGNPTFGVDGLDLIKTVDINCIDAIIGTTITVQGLDNKQFEVNIPPGTQNGTRFRLNMQGLYAMNQNQRGFLIVVANLVVPAVTDFTQVEMLKRIRNNSTN
jgi:DnaJ-class molecular chaperone